MAHDPINSGYARALLELAQAEGVAARVEEEMFRLRELLKANPALLEFLKDPNIKREGKRQALVELFQGRVHSLVLNALLTISDQIATGCLPHIHRGIHHARRRLATEGQRRNHHSHPAR